MVNKEGKEQVVQPALKSESSPADMAEFTEIFEQHHGRVFQAAFRVTGNASDAEDVLQSVFLRLLRKGQPPNRAEKLGSYLHRSAINAAIDLIRSRKARKDVPLEDVQPHILPDPQLDPSERHTALEFQTWLRGAVSELSPQAAEIFSLRYFEGYTNQEIAEMVGTSHGVVAVVLHRARNRLREEIRSFMGESHEA